MQKLEEILMNLSEESFRSNTKHLLVRSYIAEILKYYEIRAKQLDKEI